jgi:hypothetical protein
MKPIEKVQGAALTRSSLVAVLFVIAALGLLVPVAAFGQSDLIVVPIPTPTVAQPGGELELQFMVQNVGPMPTTTTAITNFIFIWDIVADGPETQLSPAGGHNAHVYRQLLPGEFEILGPVTVVIPADAPRDTVLHVAIVTDWADVEPEIFEDNNSVILAIDIMPLAIPFDIPETVIFDEISIGNVGDLFQFDGDVGDIVYAEVYSEATGSFLDSELGLLGPHPDSLLAFDGYHPELGLDTRITHPGLPSLDTYRMEVSGADSTIGTYELHLQKGIPEVEPNDYPVDAMPINYDEAMVGYLSAPGDVDYYFFFGNMGDILYLDIDSDGPFTTPPDSTFDPLVILMTASGDTIDLIDDTDEYDPALLFIIPNPDTYFLVFEDSPGGGMGTGYPEYLYAFKLRQMVGVLKPDLTPTNIAPILGTVPAGDTALVEFEAWNIGGMATLAGGVSVDILLSDDSVIDPGDSLLAVGDFEGDVPQGDFLYPSISAPIPAGTVPGTYYIGVVLDPTDTEVEEDELNNSALVQILIGPATGIETQKLPRVYALHQSYPNPSSGSTKFPYQIPGTADGRPTTQHVKLEIYNVLGQRVATLVDGSKASGEHAAHWSGLWDGRPVPSGIYFYRIEVGSFVQTRRLVLLR